jgi:hypothetical protein
MDKNFNGEELKEYRNSWLFTIVICDVLCKKYMPMPDGEPNNFLTRDMFDKSFSSKINNKINNCTEQVDRIAWEMSMQQIFFTKDKDFVAGCVKKFLKLNVNYLDNMGSQPVINRFNKIADDILSLDEEKHPYFIFKNTSVDDNVEFWFKKYNEETGEAEAVPLIEMDGQIAEFVYIENNKIIGWDDNLKFFDKKQII